MSEIKLLDCTFRDGGHLLKWRFKQETVEQVIKEISDSGIDYFELGYRSKKDQHLASEYGDLAFCEENYLREIKEKTGIKNLTIMMDVGKVDKNDFIQKSESVIDTIRVATYDVTIDEALEHVEDLFAKGYEVILNLMALTHITDSDLILIVKKINRVSNKLSAFYFADSFGSMYPDTIRKKVNLIRQYTDIDLGFHGHNNLQMAFANALTAIDAGVKYIDASLYGQGRGAGNLPTEIITAYLDSNGIREYKMDKIVNIIEQTFVGCSGKVTWGYNLDTFLTGINDIHPSYIIALRKQNISTAESYVLLHKMHQDMETFSKFNENALQKLLQER